MIKTELCNLFLKNILEIFIFGGFFLFWKRKILKTISPPI